MQLPVVHKPSDPQMAAAAASAFWQHWAVGQEVGCVAEELTVCQVHQPGHWQTVPAVDAAGARVKAAAQSSAAVSPRDRVKTRDFLIQRLLLRTHPEVLKAG
jgi:hypothetical protein